jgi:uncharacterized protein
MKPEVSAFLHSLVDIPSFNRPITGINERGASGQTPLHVAAIQGNVGLINALLSEGAEIDATGEHGYTPLHEAIEQGHSDVTQALIGAGASIEIRNADGISPRQLLFDKGWAHLVRS